MHDVGEDLSSEFAELIVQHFEVDCLYLFRIEKRKTFTTLKSFFEFSNYFQRKYSVTYADKYFFYFFLRDEKKYFSLSFPLSSGLNSFGENASISDAFSSWLFAIKKIEENKEKYRTNIADGAEDRGKFKAYQSSIIAKG